MENRRDFIRQSGLATAAFILAKPSENISTLPQEWFSPVVRKVKLLYGNMPLLSTATGAAVHVNKLATAEAANTLYHIQKKNGVRLGFIHGVAVNREASQEQDRLGLVNSSAVQLKKQGCQLIAFLEAPTHTGKSYCDVLASHSNNVDILFSNETSMPHIAQRVLLSQQGHEVIVCYLPAQGKNASIISFGFDANGKKIHFETRSGV
jgi:hypothetical protein